MASFQGARKIAELRLDHETADLLKSGPDVLQVVCESFELDSGSLQAEPSSLNHVPYGVKYALYFHTRNIEDLVRAVEIAQELAKHVLENAPHTRPNFAALLNNLSCIVHTCFLSGGGGHFLDMALDYAKIAVQYSKKEGQDYLYYMDRWDKLSVEKMILSVKMAKFRADGKINQLPTECVANKVCRLMHMRDRSSGDLAIQYGWQVVSESDPGHPDLVQNLVCLGRLLLERAQESMASPDTAIADYRDVKTLLQKAVTLSDSLSDEPECLRMLGLSHQSIAELEADQPKALGHLSEAISLSRQGIKLAINGHPRRSMLLHALATQLRVQYNRKACKETIIEAFSVIEEAFSICLSVNSKRLKTFCGTELGVICAHMYEATVDESYLNKGIKTCEGLLVSDSDSSHIGECQTVLAQLLRLRSDVTGSSSKVDLNRAVEVARHAVAALNRFPKEHPWVKSRRSILANVLSRRAKRLRCVEDIMEAQILAQDILSMCKPTDAMWPPMFNILMMCARAEFKTLGTVKDISELLKLAKKSIELISKESRDYFSHVNNLAHILALEAKISRNVHGINLAIQNLERLAAPSEHSDPHYGQRLDNLAEMLEIKYEITKKDEDLDRAVDILTIGWSVGGGAPTARIEMAYRAANLLVLKKDWKAASTLLESVIELLPYASPSRSRIDDKGYNLGRFVGLVSLAASSALQSNRLPGEVLEMIEHGRGIILGGLFQARSDVAKLRAINQPLAERFESLRDALDAPDDDAIGSGQPEVRMQLECQFKEVLEDIHTLGFDDFPTKRTGVGDLVKAADRGTIIVVNPGATHSNALVVKHGGNDVVSIKLPDLKLADIESITQQLREKAISKLGMFDMLKWLWSSLVSPIFSIPGVLHNATCHPTADTRKSRVWWIPIGPLCGLPIHAAGIYNMDSSSDGDTALDQALCSYMPSIKALLYARSRLPDPKQGSYNVEPGQGEVLLVSTEHTPRQCSLPNARTEVERLAHMLPAGVPVALYDQPASKVRSALLSSRIFHFAGHGSSDLIDPLRSALFMKDERLTVDELLKLKLNTDQDSPFLAYLSACSTGTTKSQKLVDEAMHLMSAFQMVGFRHVIGSLWELWDRQCVTVACGVYKKLIESGWTDDSVCHSLHYSISDLRPNRTGDRRRELEEDYYETDLNGWSNLKADDPRLWAAYIHVGL